MPSKRGLVVVLVGVAAVAGLAQLTGSADDGPVTDAQDRGPSGQVPDVTLSGAPLTPSAPPTALDVVQRAAVAGVTAWQDRDVASRASALARLATPDYAQLLVGVDPADVPRCTADEVRTEVESDGLARVVVSCRQDLALDVDLALQRGVWLVVDIAPGT